MIGHKQCQHCGNTTSPPTLSAFVIMSIRLYAQWQLVNINYIMNDFQAPSPKTKKRHHSIRHSFALLADSYRNCREQFWKSLIILIIITIILATVFYFFESPQQSEYSNWFKNVLWAFCVYIGDRRSWRIGRNGTRYDYWKNHRHLARHYQHPHCRRSSRYLCWWIHSCAWEWNLGKEKCWKLPKDTECLQENTMQTHRLQVHPSFHVNSVTWGEIGTVSQRHHCRS